MKLGRPLTFKEAREMCMRDIAKAERRRLESREFEAICELAQEKIMISSSHAGPCERSGQLAPVPVYQSVPVHVPRGFSYRNTWFWFASRWRPADCAMKRWSISTDRDFRGHCMDNRMWNKKSFRIFFHLGPVQFQTIFFR